VGNTYKICKTHVKYPWFANQPFRQLFCCEFEIKTSEHVHPTAPGNEGHVPLWVYPCFHYEDVNGDLTKLFHGTKSVETQIASSINIFQMLPKMLSSVPQQYSPFVGKLAKRQTNYSSSSVCVLGKASFPKVFSEEDHQKAGCALKGERPHLTFFTRVFLKCL